MGKITEEKNFNVYEEIEGLQELQDACHACYEFERSQLKFLELMEVAGEYEYLEVSLKPAPNDNTKPLAEKYPRALAYLVADETANKLNDELASIGRKARERIINEPDNYDMIIRQMRKEEVEYAKSHKGYILDSEIEYTEFIYI